MGGKMALLVLLVVGSCVYAAPVWAARGGSVVSPPEEVVGTIHVVDRRESRIVMEERNREVFATDPRQLDGLVEGEKVRLWFQQQNGRQVIYSIVPAPK
jgi:hypothetical protein